MEIAYWPRFPNAQFQAPFKLIIANIIFDQAIHRQILPLVILRGKKLMGKETRLFLSEWLCCRSFAYNKENPQIVSKHKD